MVHEFPPYKMAHKMVRDDLARLPSIVNSSGTPRGLLRGWARRDAIASDLSENSRKWEFLDSSARNIAAPVYAGDDASVTDLPRQLFRYCSFVTTIQRVAG